jgi:hypothetical protein
MTQSCDTYGALGIVSQQRSVGKTRHRSFISRIKRVLIYLQLAAVCDELELDRTEPLLFFQPHQISVAPLVLKWPWLNEDLDD